MNDIVGRLRRYAGPLCISTPAEMEAADEIERLRAELAEAQKQAAAYRFIRAGGAYIEPNEDSPAGNSGCGLKPDSWRLVPTTPHGDMLRSVGKWADAMAYETYTACSTQHRRQNNDETDRTNEQG